jgi:hypothetical protein
MSDTKREDSKPEQHAPVDPARRRLLGMVKYIPPAVIGVISLQQAGCQPDPTMSCGPSGGTGIKPPQGGPTEQADPQTDVAPET